METSEPARKKVHYQAIPAVIKYRETGGEETTMSEKLIATHMDTGIA
jgi:hypothetical protein